MTDRELLLRLRPLLLATMALDMKDCERFMMEQMTPELWQALHTVLADESEQVYRSDIVDVYLQTR
jgi:hypothetical protein